MEARRTEHEEAFLLTAEERRALVRILYVVEDNWWLDELERALLDRLELEDAAALLTAA